MEQPGLPGGVRGDELLPEGEAVGEIVPASGMNSRFQLPSGFFSWGLGESTSLAEAWLSPTTSMPRLGTAQAQKNRSTNRAFNFRFIVFPPFLRI